MLSIKYRASRIKRGASIRCASRDSTAGFTLVEMIVAVALFTVVMVVSIAALLSLVDANRKAQALQSVINNLNIAVDGTMRAVREGSNYRCDGPAPGRSDCDQTPGTALYFEPYSGDQGNPGDDWAFKFDGDGSYCGPHRLCKSEDGGIHWVSLTSPQVSIDSVNFFVIGSTRGDTAQPKVMMVIRGTAGTSKATVRTTFHIQSTAVQRVLDI